MAGKRYTVLLIPDNGAGARRLAISRRTVWLGIACFVASLLASVVLLGERAYLAFHLKRLEPFERRAEARKRVLDRLGHRLAEVDHQLERLGRLEERLRVMISLKPKERSRDLGVGGVSKEDVVGPVEGLPTAERRLAARLSRRFLDVEQRASAQEDAFGELLDAFRQQRTLLAHTPSVMPVRGWMSSGFGPRKSLFTSRREYHEGVDIVARAGTPVMATADGVVVKSRREPGYGNVVEIRHIQGLRTRYAHNQRNLVRVGQRVHRGEVIAKVGSTGRSTGPHLHYEVLLKGVAVNPTLYFAEQFALRK